MVAIAYNIVHADDPSRDVRRRIGPPGEPWEAFVLNGRGRVFQTHSAGPFSLKWMAVGRARYDVDRRARTVSRDSAILLDQDQPYEMEFDSRRECESFCVFYAPALVAQAWASVEVGFGESPDPIGPRAFPNVSFTPSPRLANLLGSVRSSGVDCDPLQLESRLLLVLEEVIALAHHHRGLVGKIPAAKPATRAHLLGLVERAERSRRVPRRRLVAGSARRGGRSVEVPPAASVSRIVRRHADRLRRVRSDAGRRDAAVGVRSFRR
jgi:hypothetical protein